MTLALNGGQPVRTEPFPPWPEYGDEERNALIRSLNQGQWWRVTGNEVASFDKEFAEFHGAPYALSVTNGTHALEVALLTLGIGPGDEVIVPAFTFISTSMAVQRVGAVPIPVDVDPDTYCIDLDCIKAAISSRTCAVIPVHMAGHVVDLDALKTIVALHKIEIIQDAAHAHGAIRNNLRIGEWNSMACFSFQNFKLMTAGEGGALLFPDEELRNKAFLFHNCGRPVDDKAYQHNVLGSNYRLNEFSAAVLREQLKRLPAQNEKREKNAALLFKHLNEIEEIIPQKRDSSVDLMSYYMVMFRLNPDFLKYLDINRDFVVNALVSEGIPAFITYRPVYNTKAFWKHPSPHGDPLFWAKLCPNTEKIAAEGIWIHHRVLLGGNQEIMDVVNAIKKVLS